MESIEKKELINESKSDERIRIIKSKFPLSLALLGWLIIGSALNSIIFASFPLRLATAEWQLNLIGSILSSSYTLLVGAALIIIAKLFNTQEKTLQNWQAMVCRLASWFAVLLVLITPLQFYVGSKALNNQSIPAAEAINKLKSFLNGVSSVNSETELRAFVTSQPNPPPLPDKFNAAFPVVKQRAIEKIKAQINAATNNAQIQKSQNLQLFLKEAIRNVAQAILMAVAFSTLASLSPKSTNQVTRFLYSLASKAK
jgi:hypothetical protein